MNQTLAMDLADAASVDAARTADPIVRMHDSSVRSAMRNISAFADDMVTGTNQLDLRVDELPDAIAAVRANPLSAKAAGHLHRVTSDLIAYATALHTQASNVRRLQLHGREQLEKFETRLAEVRRLDTDGAPADESTVNGDLAEER